MRNAVYTHSGKAGTATPARLVDMVERLEELAKSALADIEEALRLIDKAEEES